MEYDHEAPEMTDWVDFSHWSECERMARPGYVFEIANAEDQRLLTECMPEIETPWDWVSPPMRFRLVKLAPPVHSTPIPKPVG